MTRQGRTGQDASPSGPRPSHIIQSSNSLTTMTMRDSGDGTGVVLGDRTVRRTFRGQSETVIIGLKREGPASRSPEKNVATSSAGRIGLQAREWVGGPVRVDGGRIVCWATSRSTGSGPSPLGAFFSVSDVLIHSHRCDYVMTVVVSSHSRVKQ